MKLVLAIVALFSFGSVVMASYGPPDAPRVCVHNLGNDWKFVIHVRLNGTVKEAKQTIGSMTGTIPVSEQLLVFKGVSLDDNQTLEHYNISKHSDLGWSHIKSGLSANDAAYENKMTYKVVRAPASSQRRGPKPATLDIFSKGSVGFTIDCDLTDTVRTLKERIHKQEEYPVDGTTLYFVDGVMEDSHTLEFYRVGDNAAVGLISTYTWCYNDVM